MLNYELAQIFYAIADFLEIEGVGQAIAEKIEEYIHTGEIQEYNKLKKGLPKGIGQLLDIGSLGPKKVAVLYKELKIKNLKDLEKAIKKNKIAEVPGFGIKTQDNILAGIEMMKRGSE